MTNSHADDGVAGIILVRLSLDETGKQRILVGNRSAGFPAENSNQGQAVLFEPPAIRHCRKTV